MDPEPRKYCAACKGEIWVDAMLREFHGLFSLLDVSSLMQIRFSPGSATTSGRLFAGGACPSLRGASWIKACWIFSAVLANYLIPSSIWMIAGTTLQHDRILNHTDVEQALVPSQIDHGIHVRLPNGTEDISGRM